MRLIDPLVAAARAWPDRPAVSDGAVRWTYGQLERIAARGARWLAAQGIGRGDRVALLAGESAATVAAIHAVRRAGGVLLLLNRRAAPSELGTQLDALRPAALLHDAATADLAQSALSDQSALAAGRDGPALVALAALLDVQYDRTLVEGPLDPKSDAELDPEMLDPDAPATLIFTSGTTGRPKAAVLSHGAHAASAAAWAAFLRPAPTDRWLSCLPFHHVAGLAMIDRSARWGLPLDIHDRFDPAAVSAALQTGRISHVSLVGTMLRSLLDVPEEVAGGGPVAPTVRAILLGGERTPAELIVAAIQAGLPVVPTYGLTETASGVVALPTGEASEHPAAAGRAMPGVAIRIRLNDRPASPDEVGEVEILGGMLCSGYVDSPADATTVMAATQPDGWFRTGDLGSLDASGLLTVADRRDDLIVSGGENIYPAEVEAVLRRHPGVVDAAVVGRSDRRWGAVPVAVIVASEVDPTDEALAAHCRAELARYKVPVAFERVAVLPRTAGGKLRRREIRNRLAGTPVVRPTAPDPVAPDPVAPDPVAPGLVTRLAYRNDDDWAQLRRLRLPDVVLAYRRTGDGPPLVLLHGTLSCATHLRRLAARLATEFTVVAIDRRGSGDTELPSVGPPVPAEPLSPTDARPTSGRSSAPAAPVESPAPGPIDVAVHIADVSAVLAAEKLGTALFVGHSYGGCLALEVAARRPELTAGVWAYEPPYAPVGGPAVRAALAALSQRTAAAARRGGPAAAAEVFLTAVAGAEALGRLAPAALSRVRVAGSGAIADAALLGLEPDGLARIEAPVEIALGGASDPIYAELADALATRIADATIARLPGCRHDAPMTDPDAIAAAIRRFAERQRSIPPRRPRS